MVENLVIVYNTGSRNIELTNHLEQAKMPYDDMDVKNKFSNRYPGS
jgi:hypothetical protein